MYVKKILRKQINLISAVIVLAFVAVLLPSNWGPTPVAERIRPLTYNSQISGPTKIDYSQSPTRFPTDITLSMSFLVRARPSIVAYLFSTSEGLGEGIKVAIDQYGNLYLSIENDVGEVGDYQLIKISDPGKINSWQNLSVKLNLVESKIEIYLDNRSVPILEPRPLKLFDRANMAINISKFEIGGSEKYNFDGEIKNVQITFAKKELVKNLINLKLLLFLVSLALGILFLSRVRESQDDERLLS